MIRRLQKNRESSYAILLKFQVSLESLSSLPRQSLGERPGIRSIGTSALSISRQIASQATSLENRLTCTNSQWCSLLLREISSLSSRPTFSNPPSSSTPSSQI